MPWSLVVRWGLTSEPKDLVMKQPLAGVPTQVNGDDATRMPVKSPQGRATPNHLYVLGLCSVAALGGFLFGFDSGVVNGAVNALSVAFGTKAAETGFAVASVLLGCAVGAFGAGTLANRIGRRPTMLLNAVFFLVSAFVSGAAGTPG